MTIQQAFELGFQHHQAGRMVEAEALYRQVLAVEGGHVDALHLLGVVALQTGRPGLAAELFGRVSAAVPNHPVVYSNLGEALRQMGRLDEAVASFQRALQLKADDPMALYNLGNALLDSGKARDAIAAYQRALELQPDYADAYNNLGIAFARIGAAGEAVEAYRRALQLAPDHGDAWNNLGIVLAEEGRFGEAVEAYQHALRLFPEQAETYNNLGNACQKLGQFEEAKAAYHRALGFRPEVAEFHANLGNALREQGRLGEAIASYDRALALQPKRAETYNELGNTLKEQGRLDDAVEAYCTALTLKAGYAEAESNLGNVLGVQGQVEEAIATYRRALEFRPEDFRAHSNLIYMLEFFPGRDDEMIAREQRLWNERFARVVSRSVPVHANRPDPGRRLRVGYVSPDFREHVIGRNVMPLFKAHDREAFEIFCYSGVVRPDGMTGQFRERADHWRITLGLNDGALAEMIRRDAVDILVDLTQHMAGNRLTMFARWPAPVQVSFAGYPAGTGVEAIDYRMSDRFLEPGPEEERVILIDSFWCYDPCGAEVSVNELPARRDGRVTFGCLNNFCKVNEPTLRLWAKVLTRMPGSRLLLLSAEGNHRQRAGQILEREGVAANRLEFVAPRARLAYLELYHRVDVMLDTFPYNGHTTSLDALWMGVPVVSRVGEWAVSRAGLSQLSHLGLAEWVASSEEGFVETAARLARDIDHLADLRRTLRARLEASALMDGSHFTRQIEAAYRAVWRRWCEEKAGAR